MDLAPARQGVHRSSRASPDRGPIGKIAVCCRPSYRLPVANCHGAVPWAQSFVAAACCARGLRSSSALLSSLKRGAERRKAQGLARPHRPLRTASTRLRSVSGSRCDGDPRLSALHHGVFVRPAHTSGRACKSGLLALSPGGPAGSLRTGLSARKAGSEAPRESGQLAGRAGAVPASAKRRYPEWRPSTSRR